MDEKRDEENDDSFWGDEKGLMTDEQRDVKCHWRVFHVPMRL